MENPVLATDTCRRCLARLQAFLPVFMPEYPALAALREKACIMLHGSTTLGVDDGTSDPDVWFAVPDNDYEVLRANAGVTFFTFKIEDFRQSRPHEQRGWPERGGCRSSAHRDVRSIGYHEIKVVDSSFAPAGNGLFRGLEYIDPEGLESRDIRALLACDAEHLDKGNRRLAFMALDGGGIRTREARGVRMCKEYPRFVMERHA